MQHWKPANNNLIVKFGGDYDYIPTGNGTSIKAVPTYDPQFYKGISGEVVAVPDKLLFLGHRVANLKRRITGKKLPSFHLRNVQYWKSLSIPRETSMEVKVGDKIYFHFFQHTECMEEGRYIIENDELFLFIPYKECICVKRGDEVIPLNGYILVEPIEMTAEEKTAYGLEVVFNDQYATQKGVVRFLGEPSKADLDNANLKEDSNITLGQTVYFAVNDNVPVEYDLFQEIAPGKKIMYMTRSAILGY